MSLFKRLNVGRYLPGRESNERSFWSFLESSREVVNSHSGVLEFGPVAGAYFPLAFKSHVSPLANGAIANLHVGFDLVPVYLSAGVDVGTVDVTITTNGNALLTSALGVSASASELNAAEDFSQNVEPGMLVVTLANVASAPTMIDIMLICVNAGKVGTT